MRSVVWSAVVACSPVLVAVAAHEGRGAGEYDPVIEPANFVAVIDNPFLPLKPGTTFTYENDNRETVTTFVTHRTKRVLGVKCTVVRDTETADGELKEATLDWYAQDKDGNVWYFGEDSKAYRDGVAVSTGGSWEAGVDGAKPGIIMQAHPTVGEPYYQEYCPGEAEDMAKVLRLDASASVPFGDFDNCLVTEEWSPLEPGHIEHKYYARGVGLLSEGAPERPGSSKLAKVTRD